MGFGMMGFGLLMMLLVTLVLVGVLAVGVWAVVHFAGARNGGGGGEARRILDERYARGEIDHQEYQLRKRELG